jgi:hypothetical protein
VDDLQLYTRALTADEVALVFNERPHWKAEKTLSEIAPGARSVVERMARGGSVTAIIEDEDPSKNCYRVTIVKQDTTIAFTVRKDGVVLGYEVVVAKVAGGTKED